MRSSSRNSVETQPMSSIRHQQQQPQQVVTNQLVKPFAGSPTVPLQYHQAGGEHEDDGTMLHGDGDATAGTGMSTIICKATPQTTPQPRNRSGGVAATAAVDRGERKFVTASETSNATSSTTTSDDIIGVGGVPVNFQRTSTGVPQATTTTTTTVTALSSSSSSSSMSSSRAAVSSSTVTVGVNPPLHAGKGHRQDMESGFDQHNENNKNNNNIQIFPPSPGLRGKQAAASTITTSIEHVPSTLEQDNGNFRSQHQQLQQHQQHNQARTNTMMLLTLGSDDDGASQQLLMTMRINDATTQQQQQQQQRQQQQQSSSGGGDLLMIPNGNESDIAAMKTFVLPSNTSSVAVAERDAEIEYDDELPLFQDSMNATNNHVTRNLMQSHTVDDEEEEKSIMTLDDDDNDDGDSDNDGSVKTSNNSSNRNSSDITNNHHHQRHHNRNSGDKSATFDISPGRFNIVAPNDLESQDDGGGSQQLFFNGVANGLSHRHHVQRPPPQQQRQPRKAADVLLLNSMDDSCAPLFPSSEPQSTAAQSAENTLRSNFSTMTATTTTTNNTVFAGNTFNILDNNTGTATTTTTNTNTNTTESGMQSRDATKSNSQKQLLAAGQDEKKLGGATPRRKLSTSASGSAIKADVVLFRNDGDGDDNSNRGDAVVLAAEQQLQTTPAKVAPKRRQRQEEEQQQLCEDGGDSGMENQQQQQPSGLSRPVQYDSGKTTRAPTAVTSPEQYTSRSPAVATTNSTSGGVKHTSSSSPSSSPSSSSCVSSSSIGHVVNDENNNNNSTTSNNSSGALSSPSSSATKGNKKEQQQQQQQPTHTRLPVGEGSPVEVKWGKAWIRGKVAHTEQDFHYVHIEWKNGKIDRYRAKDVRLVPESWLDPSETAAATTTTTPAAAAAAAATASASGASASASSGVGQDGEQKQRQKSSALTNQSDDRSSVVFSATQLVNEEGLNDDDDNNNNNDKNGSREIIQASGSSTGSMASNGNNTNSFSNASWHSADRRQQQQQHLHGPLTPRLTQQPRSNTNSSSGGLSASSVEKRLSLGSAAMSIPLLQQQQQQQQQQITPKSANGGNSSTTTTRCGNASAEAAAAAAALMMASSSTQPSLPSLAGYHIAFVDTPGDYLRIEAAGGKVFRRTSELFEVAARSLLEPSLRIVVFVQTAPHPESVQQHHKKKNKLHAAAAAASASGAITTQPPLPAGLVYSAFAKPETASHSLILGAAALGLKVFDLQWMFTSCDPEKLPLFASHIDFNTTGRPVSGSGMQPIPLSRRTLFGRTIAVDGPSRNELHMFNQRSLSFASIVSQVAAAAVGAAAPFSSSPSASLPGSPSYFNSSSFSIGAAALAVAAKSAAKEQEIRLRFAALLSEAGATLVHDANQQHPQQVDCVFVEDGHAVQAETPVPMHIPLERNAWVEKTLRTGRVEFLDGATASTPSPPSASLLPDMMVSIVVGGSDDESAKASQKNSHNRNGNRSSNCDNKKKSSRPDVDGAATGAANDGDNDDDEDDDVKKTPLLTPHFATQKLSADLLKSCLLIPQRNPVDSAEHGQLNLTADPKSVASSSSSSSSSSGDDDGEGSMAATDIVSEPVDTSGEQRDGSFDLGDKQEQDGERLREDVDGGNAQQHVTDDGEETTTNEEKEPECEEEEESARQQQQQQYQIGQDWLCDPSALYDDDDDKSSLQQNQNVAMGPQPVRIVSLRFLSQGLITVCPYEFVTDGRMAISKWARPIQRVRLMNGTTYHVPPSALLEAEVFVLSDHQLNFVFLLDDRPGSPTPNRASAAGSTTNARQSSASLPAAHGSSTK